MQKESKEQEPRCFCKASHEAKMMQFKKTAATGLQWCSCSQISLGTWCGIECLSLKMMANSYDHAAAARKESEKSKCARIGSARK